MHHRIADASAGRQIFQCARMTIEREQLGASLVDTLDLTSLPAAVRWFIVSIGINPIKGSGWRGAWSEIGQKVLKRSTPSLTDANTTSTIAFKGRVFVTATTIEHSSPRMIFGRIRGAVGRRSLVQFLHAQTATRSTDASLHVAPVWFTDGSTVALTAHARMFRVGAEKGQNRQPSESFAWLRFGFLSAFARLFTFQAAAGFCGASAQTVACHDRSLSTRTLTQPRDAKRMFSTLHHGQSRECLTSQINKPWHC